MERYDEVSQHTSEMIAKSYSTSFSMATRLFTSDIKRHIYNIYGLVRVADEIVDTYGGTDATRLLNTLELDVYQVLQSGYSSNPVVQAFGLTARQFKIGRPLIAPFFTSMRTDLTRKSFNEKQYAEYIHGSAEVIGLMCLKIFCPGKHDYNQLAPGAQALGSAFQKINFLRDFADDYQRLGRCYFPNASFASFDTAAQKTIVEDIADDLAKASAALSQLPASSRPAVRLAYQYYSRLLHRLASASPEEIKHQRIRVHDSYKLILFTRSWLAGQLRHG